MKIPSAGGARRIVIEHRCAASFLSNELGFVSSVNTCPSSIRSGPCLDVENAGVLEATDMLRLVCVDPFGVFSQRGKQQCFTERVLVPRPRLLSSLWCLCVLCVLRGVMGRLVFWVNPRRTPTCWTTGLCWCACRRHVGQGKIPIVAPVHACRREFAMLSCAVMVSLPQTALGAGIEPTSEELQQIGDVAGIFSWLGSGESVRSAFIRVLGGGQPRLRDLVRVPCRSWKLTMSQWCGATRVCAWASLRRTKWSQQLIFQVGCWGSAVPRLRRRVLAPSPLAVSGSRSSLAQRWALSLRVLRRLKSGRCSHPTSRCEEPNPPRTPSRTWSK